VGHQEGRACRRPAPRGRLGAAGDLLRLPEGALEAPLQVRLAISGGLELLLADALLLRIEVCVFDLARQALGVAVADALTEPALDVVVDDLPFAQERLRLRSDGRVALELKMAWRDGTRELVFEPLEFLERLAAMTPRPETNLLICHGVLAPRARWRDRVVAYGRVAPEPTALAPPVAPGPDGTGVKSTPRGWTWAALMHRAFAIDVLACPHCGGRLRLIATLHDPAVIRKILAHLGVGPSGPSPGPAPPKPGAATS